MQTVQYVYVLSNSLYPSDVFKIGSTKENPSTRAYQLQSTGVPVPFTIEYIIVTSNGDKLEKEIHRHLHDYRVNPKREFFKIDKSNLYQILTDEMGLKMIPFSEFHYIPTPSEPTNIPQAEPVVDHESEHVFEPTNFDLTDIRHCEVCDVTFSSIYALRKHLKTKLHKRKQIPTTKKYPCPCGKQYSHRQTLYAHRKQCEIYKNPQTKEEQATSEPVSAHKEELDPLQTNNELSMIDSRNADLVLSIHELQKGMDAMKIDAKIRNLEQKLEIAELKIKIGELNNK
jgi:hypothetical protein